jgi:multicomponent Na+:H+ antiporter subunit E
VYEVLRLEARVVRAFGTRADVAALDADEAGGQGGPGGPGGTAGGGNSRTEGGPWTSS